jgi:hypothetical protein
MELILGFMETFLLNHRFAWSYALKPRDCLAKIPQTVVYHNAQITNMVIKQETGHAFHSAPSSVVSYGLLKSPSISA